MQKLKRIIACVLAVCVLCGFAGCGDAGKKEKSDKLSIVCTLFPQYDFVREIVGGKADVTLLLTPGTDSHSYDPSPADMVKISECDLFVYTGNLMEAWTAQVIETLPESVKVLNVSDGLELSAVKQEDKEDIDEHEHEHAADPHVWTNPQNAVKISRRIADMLCEIDPDNTDEYTASANEYIKKLEALDEEIEKAVKAADYKKIVICDRFSMHYFCQRYGIDYIAAFDSCTANTEPSPAVIVEITNEVKENNIPAVFAAELSNRKVADAVAEQTGAAVLELHSCHNLSAEDFDAGESYLSLMQRNLQNLKIAFGEA